jgi:uncharacterized protein (DUF1684 family)
MRLAFLLAAAALTWQQGVEQYRAEYEASLKAPDGWLTVTGLVWLQEGDNQVAPFGVVRRDADAIRVGGKALKPDSPDSVTVGDVTLTIIARGGKLGARLRDRNAAALRNFTGCQWYPISKEWHVTAKWVAQPSKLPIVNVLGMKMEEDSPGYAEFTLKGKKLRLTPVTEGDHLFFMMKDLTAGKTTYGAGRFLYAGMPKDGTVDLDFNKAENPPCAFTAFATCPLPPKQNQLPIAVEAGEKKYGHF